MLSFGLAALKFIPKLFGFVIKLFEPLLDPKVIPGLLICVAIASWLAKGYGEDRVHVLWDAANAKAQAEQQKADLKAQAEQDELENREITDLEAKNAEAQAQIEEYERLLREERERQPDTPHGRDCPPVSNTARNCLLDDLDVEQLR